MNNPLTTPDRGRFHRFWFGLFPGLLILLLTAGCGKKAPPVAPEAVPPPAVSDLQARRQNDQVQLTWSINKGQAALSDGLSAFVVYRTCRAMDAPPCPDCPRKFQKITRLPASRMPVTDSGRLLGRYQEPVRPGRTCFFYVQPYGRNNLAGERSPTVRLDCPPRDKGAH